MSDEEKVVEVGIETQINQNQDPIHRDEDIQHPKTDDPPSQANPIQSNVKTKQKNHNHYQRQYLRIAKRKTGN
jgi:hypothetical protein